MRRLKIIIAGLIATLGLGLVSLSAPVVLADGIEEGLNIVKDNNDTLDRDLNTSVIQIINTVLLVVGIIAVGFLIYGGVRYIISRGTPEEIKNAKNTIMYSIIGLIVVILAYAVVEFVIKGV
ncbi:MAG: pilin [Candidatus Nomurabacteria bacterium]|nr:pilin [Candidatus Nomurabacteria bacterium]